MAEKMTQRDVEARIRAEQSRTLGNIAIEDELPGQTFWLSFADADGFRGAVIVHANDFVEALMRTNLMEINPHGECQGMSIPAATAAKIPSKWKNRVLDRNECEQFDKEMSATQ